MQTRKEKKVSKARPSFLYLHCKLLWLKTRSEKQWRKKTMKVHRQITNELVRKKSGQYIGILLAAWLADFLFRETWIYIYVICRLGGPYSEKLTEVLKMLRGHSFSLYGPTLSRQITLFIFSCDKLAYNWIYTTLLLNWFTCRLQTIVKNLTNERASKLRHYTKKDVLKNRLKLHYKHNFG